MEWTVFTAVKKNLNGRFQSKARRKRVSAIIAEKKDISLRNVDQPIKPLPLRSRGRAPKEIKEKGEISARKRFINCEKKRKNEIKAQIAFPFIFI